MPEDVVILQEKHISEKKIVLRNLPMRRIPESEAPDIKRYIKYIKDRQKLGETDWACRSCFYYGEHDQFAVAYRVVLKDSIRAIEP